MEPDRGSDFAHDLRGFGPVGILAMLVILVAGGISFVPVAGLAVLLWVRESGTPWREIGYVRPRSWWRTISAGIALGVALKFVMKAVVMPLLGANPVNQAYHYLAGNRAALPVAIATMIFRAGFGEETVYRGFLFERLYKLFGTGARAKAVIVIITSVWFGFGHYAVQGLAGAEQALITGLVFGTIMAVRGRIWVLMFAHAAYDLAAVAMIFWNLEARVAHLVFR